MHGCNIQYLLMSFVSQKQHEDEDQPQSLSPQGETAFKYYLLSLNEAVNFPQ